MALEIVIIHFLAGVALGLRFKVLILVPAVTLTMLFAAIVGVARGDMFWSIAIAMILLVTAIQVGYLAGILIRAKIERCERRSQCRKLWRYPGLARLCGFTFHYRYVLCDKRLSKRIFMSNENERFSR
jgi:hypothetical protein